MLAWLLVPALSWAGPPDCYARSAAGLQLCATGGVQAPTALEKPDRIPSGRRFVARCQERGRTTATVDSPAHWSGIVAMRVLTVDAAGNQVAENRHVHTAYDVHVLLLEQPVELVYMVPPSDCATDTGTKRCTGAVCVQGWPKGGRRGWYRIERATLTDPYADPAGRSPVRGRDRRREAGHPSTLPHAPRWTLVLETR